MTPDQIEELGPAFVEYLEPFLFCCDYTQTFDLFGVYCRGAALGPAAQDLRADRPGRGRGGPHPAGVPDHGWSFARARTLLQQHLARALPRLPADDLGSVGLHDETGTAKSGGCTPGVQRQYCGELGKLENCIVTVHTGVARGSYQTLFDADLFLPQSWDADHPRCRKAGIPDTVVYRPKWQIALDQLDRALAQGLRFDWFTFDEGYGDKPGYLQGLDGRQQRYVGEVPKSFRCFGRPPRPGQRASRADDLVRQSALFHRQSWQVVRLARQTVGDQEWQVKAARVWLAWGGGRTSWLLWARHPRTGEEKYFVANAAADEPVERLLRVALVRWTIEHGIRLSKSEIGFRHFEGRHYTALLRHLTLCCLTLTFVAGRAADLRGEESGGHRRAGLPRFELGIRDVAAGATGDEPTGVYVGSHSLSPAA